MSSSERSRHTHRKRWGQNFLRNQGAIERIAEAAAPQAGELVLEIGPGEGALTMALARRGARLRLIEIDPKLIERLNRQFHDAPVEVIHGDALEVELPEEPFRAAGNLPYNVANPIIRRVLRSPRCAGAVFMVQKEVADRYVAQQGDEGYGYLTLTTRLRARARRLLTLGPASFFPRPKVSSSVVQFEIHDPGLETGREVLEELLSLAFRQPRKKLSNNLEGWRERSKGEIEAALSAAGLDPATRAERLDLADFDRLALTLAHD